MLSVQCNLHSVWITSYGGEAWKGKMHTSGVTHKPYIRNHVPCLFYIGFKAYDITCLMLLSTMGQLAAACIHTCMQQGVTLSASDSCHHNGFLDVVIVQDFFCVDFIPHHIPGIWSWFASCDTAANNCSVPSIIFVIQYWILSDLLSWWNRVVLEMFLDILPDQSEVEIWQPIFVFFWKILAFRNTLWNAFFWCFDAACPSAKWYFL